MPPPPVRRGTSFGIYSGALSALTRSSEEKAANNAARTELLKALGCAFNVKGKARLVGKMATVTVPEVKDDKYVFKPVMEDGKALVRPLTAEDVDILGPACLANVIGAI